MKKPNDSADAGWYDDPEIQGNERYWNGKYWDNKTRKIGEITEDGIPYGEYKLGLFWFRYPLNRDKLFVAYCVLLGLSVISGIYQDSNSGNKSIQLLIIYLIVFVPVSALYVYALFAPFLFFRRKKDKRKGIEVASKISWSRPRIIKWTLGGIVGIFTALFIIGSISSSENSGVSDSSYANFINKQERISEVLKKYNVDAAVAVGVVRDVSDRNISTGDAIAKFTQASEAITTHLSNLRDICLGIDFPPLSGEGEVLAFAKLMNVLRAGCEITPKQFLTLQEIFQSQIDDESSQDDLDLLSAELEELNQQKIKITIDGLEAALPYLKETEAIYVRQLLESFKRR